MYDDRAEILRYLHSDHLGSTVLTTNSGGSSSGTQQYCAYGKNRDGSSCASGNDLLTDHHFTGQKYDNTGLHYYNARYYDDHLGQFISPDTIVPDPTNVLDYNRFMYTRGNPLKYNDPTGHCAANDDGSPDFAGDAKCYERAAEYYYTGPDSLRDVYPDFGEYNKSFATAVSQEGFESMLCSLWCSWHSEKGVHHERYNPEPTMNPIPAGANDMPSLPNPCSFWDCPAIALNAASLGTSILQTSAFACTATGAGAPVCGPSAQYLTAVDYGLSGASVIYETGKYWSGQSTALDASVTYTDDVAKPVLDAVRKGLGSHVSATPVVGVVYDSITLGYEIGIAPFISTPGGHKVTK